MLRVDTARGVAELATAAKGQAEGGWVRLETAKGKPALPKPAP